MSTRKESERVKLIQEKCQTLLTQMLRDEDNKYCVDCDAKGPRWASWNLGVFLCIRCAGIHRNLGVHISRVKSVNLDAWTPEQVVSLQQMGNSRARAVYEAQLPDGFRRPQMDSALESFIRAKYEHKKYLAREWVPPTPPKVDWGKEIDEEIEKQKRKKKSVQSSLGIVTPLCDKKLTTTGIKSPIPAPIPKPKSSSSPKISRTEVSQSSSDLLGLSSPTNSCGSSSKGVCDLQGDSFSGFLSAPIVSASINGISSNAPTINDNKGSGANELAKEEADFFSQSNVSISGEKEKGKLTKDSILALYGAAPTGSIGQFSNNPLVGFNNQFSQSQVAGQFMQMSVTQQPQTFPALVPASVAPVGGVLPPQAQFGNVSTNLSLNLAGMPPGLLGPPQPHQHTQFMTPPNSTTMYSAPVMTAPGAFTSAIPQQMLSQPTFAQFPPQAFGGIPTGFGSTISSVGPTGVPATAQSTSANLSQQFGNLNLGNVWQ